MITCNILGPCKNNSGLGNQIFCVAATLSLAKNNKDRAVFPELNYRPFKFYGETIFHKLDKYVFDKSFVKAHYKEPSYSSTIHNPINYCENLCINGYFQSHKYFKGNEDYIRDMIQLPSPMRKKIDEEYDFISKDKTVSIHFRRGDYLQLKHHYHQLDENYYMEALKTVGEYDSVVVFSDDISWARDNCGFIKKQTHFIDSGCDVTDLYLMSKTKHNIIANSTFSWWGAFLNDNPNKIVVAPKGWFKDKNRNTEDLMPNNWIRV